MTPDGRAIVIWRGSNEGHRTTSFIASATQAAAGAGWTAAVGIRGSYEGEEPQVATTPTGETVAMWGASYNEETGIDVANRQATGRWEGLKRLATPGTFPDPHLAITSDGEAIGAWVVEPEEGAGTIVQVASRPSGANGRWRPSPRRTSGATPRS